MSEFYGIDVSVHNGTIDWNNVAASGKEFAMIRAGYGNSINQKDKNFDANITGALKAGLLVGVYWFSYADSEEDVRREWEVCSQVIAPYKSRISLPVAFDYEYDSERYYKEKYGQAPSNTLINSMADVFLSLVRIGGYKPILYTNNDYRRNKFSVALLAKYPLWLADYTGGPDAKCAIQQTSSTGSVAGISGNVDLNTAYVDYGFSKRSVVESDTTQDVAIARGAYYTAKFTGAENIIVTAGTGDVVTLVPVRKEPTTYLVAIVPIGKVGHATGIYAYVPGEEPTKWFNVRIL